jgi:bis(5'-nucleosyl)-tetraphosphatase (symmetrical)
VQQFKDDMDRTIFIGDVHGCAEELSQLLDLLDFDGNMDQVFLTGDAFTKGPDPLGVWHLIKQTSAQMVMGNHDAALLNRLKIRHLGKEKRLNPEIKSTLDALMPVVDNLTAWIEQLSLYIETEKFLLVHAGIHPVRGLSGTSPEEFMAIRTWPPQKGVEGPRWHAAYKSVHPLLVFGHDAPNGLVVKQKKGVPYLVGLDSGCVYGRALSAYVLEAKKVVQVRSRQRVQFPD